MARRGITAEQLASHSGVHLRTIRKVLAGNQRPQPATLHRVAQGLKASVDEFFQDAVSLAQRLDASQQAPGRQAASSDLAPQAELCREQTPCLSFREWDRQANTAVAEVLEEKPQLFADWTEADFDELYSRFGTGGQLTHQGVEQMAVAQNQARSAHEKLALVLETADRALALSMLELLYERNVLKPGQLKNLRPSDPYAKQPKQSLKAEVHKPENP